MTRHNSWIFSETFSYDPYWNIISWSLNGVFIRFGRFPTADSVTYFLWQTWLKGSNAEFATFPPLHDSIYGVCLRALSLTFVAFVEWSLLLFRLTSSTLNPLFHQFNPRFVYNLLFFIWLMNYFFSFVLEEINLLCRSECCYSLKHCLRTLPKSQV